MSPHRLSNVVVTADDWGMSPAINRGILELARRGLVTRVSMMSDAPHLKVGLEELLALDGVRFGLHFDLTHGPRKKLAPWLFASRPALVREFERQLEILRRHEVDVTYIDGHQHVHLLPNVIHALRETLRKNDIRETRIPFDPKQWISRRPFLNWLCLYARAVLGHEFETTPCLYPRASDFRSLETLKRRLERADGAEVILHPAIRDDLTELGIEDSYREGRVREFTLITRLAGTSV